MTTLEEFASWPKSSEDATSEALCRYFTVSAFARDKVLGPIPGIGSDKAEKEKYWSELGHVVYQFAIVSLLRFLQEFHEDVADDAAAEIFDMMNDGGVIPELLWDWLEEYKIDPELVEKTANEAVKKPSAA